MRKSDFEIHEAERTGPIGGVLASRRGSPREVEGIGAPAIGIRTVPAPVAISLLALLTAVALICMASPALALQAHLFKGTVGAGELSSPVGLAVDDANGDLLVADAGLGAVEKYDSSGQSAQFSGLGAASLAAPGVRGVAIDNSGSANAGHFYVVTNAGLYAYTAAGEAADFSASASYISANQITGSSAQGFYEPKSVAVDSNGYIYITDYYGTAIYNPDGEYQTSNVAYNRSASTVDSNGVIYQTSIWGELSKITPSTFPVTSSTTYSTAGVAISGVSASGIAADRSDDNIYLKAEGKVVQLSSAVTGNTPVITFGTEQLTDGSAGIAVDGSTGPTGGDVYATTGSQVEHYGPLVTLPAEPPTGSGEAAIPVYAEAELRATIDLGNIETSYWFEYGKTANYGQSTQHEAKPEGAKPVKVSATIFGLEEGSQYHFRIVAQNASGTFRGPDATFTTKSRAVAGSCPNEAIRLLEHATGLADCRAWEQVTPVDKVGGLFYKAEIMPQASPDGNGMLYSSAAAVDSPISAAAPVLNLYTSTRSEAGWEAHGVSLPGHGEIEWAPYFSGTMAVADDNRSAIVVSNEVLAPGAVEGNENVYLRNLVSGSVTLVSSLPYGTVYFTFGQFFTATPDLSPFFLLSPEPLTGESLPAGTFGLYEYSNGGLTLISKGPGGTVLEGIPSQAQFGRGVSDDGGRLAFSMGWEKGAYLREGGEVKPISVSQRAGDSDEVQPAEVVSMSADGRYTVITVTVPVPLTEGAPSTNNSYYRYDARSGRLTYLDGMTEGAFALAVSADGTTIAFYSSTGSEGPGLYVWRDGQTSLLSSRFQADSTHNSEYSSPLGISPNGRYLALSTTSQLTDDDTVNTHACSHVSYQSVGICTSVYILDADSKDVVCASCAPDGSAPLGAASMNISTNLPGYSQRLVTDSGQAYFDTPTSLVPADANGERDVYAYSRATGPLLLSAGAPNAEARISDASVDGKDVFFATNARLVSQDRDVYFDVYDARVNGGLAAQNSAPTESPCSGVGCRVPSAGVAPPSVGSEGSSGDGNVRVRSGKHAKKRLACKKLRGKRKQRCQAKRHKSKRPACKKLRGKQKQRCQARQSKLQRQHRKHVGVATRGGSK